MKRLPLVLTLLASLALAVGPASADNATALISGSGWRLAKAGGQPVREFTMSAWSVGGHVIGSYKFGSISGLVFSGPVTCAKVAGNQGVIGGPITVSNDASFVGKSFLVFVTDNGRHQFGQIGPDTLSGTYVLPDEIGSVSGDIPTNFPARCPALDGLSAGKGFADVNDMTGDIAVWSGN